MGVSVFTNKNGDWYQEDIYLQDCVYLDELFDRVSLDCSRIVANFHSNKFTEQEVQLITSCWLTCWLGASLEHWRFQHGAELDVDGEWQFHNRHNRIASRFPNSTADSLRLFQSGSVQLSRIEKRKQARSRVKFHENIAERLNNLLAKCSDILKSLVYRELELWRSRSKTYSVIAVSSYISVSNLAALSKEVGEILNVSPRILTVGTGRKLFKRKHAPRNLKSEFFTENSFERALRRSLFDFMPTYFLEELNLNFSHAKRFPLAEKILLTANAHLWSDIFNLWAIRHRRNGVKIFACQHGGCLPKTMNMLHFVEKCFDASLVWHRPIHPNQVRVPAQAFLSNQEIEKAQGNAHNILLLVPFDPQIVPQRAQKCPAREICADEFEQKSKFLRSILERKLSIEISIRARKSREYTNIGQRLLDHFPASKVDNYDTLLEGLNVKRVAVCGYPQTAFAELLMSNCPVILLWLDWAWDVNKSFSNLVEELIDAKLCFSSAEQAADHVEQIWDDVESWWLTDKTQDVRKKVIKECLWDTSEWRSEWISVLKGEIGESAI